MASLPAIHEGATGRFTAYLLDEDGVAIASASVSAITMTLRHRFSNTIVNSRSAQNVFNTNNCTLHATSGLFTWNVQTADAAIVDNSNPPRDIDEHEMILTATYTATGPLTKVAKHKEIIRVLNLARTP